MKGGVLIVSNLYPPHVVGGAEVVARRQAVELARRGWRVEVLSGRFAQSPDKVGTLEQEDYDGLPIYRLNLVSLDPDDNFRWETANRVLTSLMTRGRPDWVHFHNVAGLGAELIRVAKRLGARVAVTLHDHWGVCFMNTRLREDGSLCRNFQACAACRRAISPRGEVALPMRLRRDYVAFCLGEADLLISPSRSLADAYRESGFAGQSLTVVSNGIDLGNIPAGRRMREGEAKTRFLVASYFGAHKGIQVILEALRRLAGIEDLAGKWEAAFAGHGQLEGDIQALAADPALGGAVVLRGRLPREELLTRLREVHVVILASIWPENEPVVLLEAIASGAAVIATDIGGNRDILSDYNPGLSCAPGDPADLARAMESLIRDPDRIEAISRNNLDFAPLLDEARAIDRIEALYVQPRKADKGDARVVVCAGGAPDEATFRAIEALAGDARNHSLRLVWIGWADAEVWERASGFWWWGETGGLGAFGQAARRGVSICARASAETARLRRFLTIEVYSRETQLFDWLAQRAARAPVAAIAGERVLQRFDQLRIRDDFHLPAEG